MRKEIRQLKNTSGLKSGLPSASFLFPPAFSGFAGHFPGRPVLPGVCMLQAVAATLEDWHGQAVQILEVRKARFLALLAPGDTLYVECVQQNGDGNGQTARFSLRRHGDSKSSECTLRYTTTNVVPS